MSFLQRCLAGKKKHPVLFWVSWGVLGLLSLGLLLYLFTAYFLPLPGELLEIKPTPATKIFDRKGVLLYEVYGKGEGKKSTIALSEVPQHFKNATLSAEDINFYNHSGVDVGAILRAIFYNVREQRIVSGASTIPQQLVRNSLEIGASRRGYADKILEALYSIRISHLYSKDQIFELYLNKIYYGNLSYGSEAAALDYFGKHLGNLDLAESAFLAGLPQRPSEYNPFLYFEQAKKRQQYVLRQMVKYNFISSEEANEAAAEPLHLRKNKVEMKAPHFVHYVLNQLDQKLDSLSASQSGLSVYTTLDYDLQKQAEEIISKQISALQDKHVSNGALLSLDPKTGQILAWVGSENYFDNSIDGAVDMVLALRQPGSVIKPFNYLLALEKGYTPATILADIPTVFSTDGGPYSPKNYDLKFHGPVRLRNALASSFNIPAVRTLDFVGIGQFITFLKSLGIETLDRDPDFYGLALTLGGGEVRMIDMAKAFNTLANYGFKKDLNSILKIHDDATKETLYEWNAQPAQNVLGSHGREHAYQIIDILKDPVARLGGFGEGSVLELSREAAVKTGTTRNFRDNWTIGFTPDLLTTVWVGNADASSMHNMSGVDGAGPIWHDFMEAALSTLPSSSFDRPSRLKEVEICALSGKRPTEFCQDRSYEWFVPGTEPKENDDYFQQFWVLKNSGHIVPDACVKKYSPDTLEQKIFIVYPAVFQKWALENGFSLPAMERCEIKNNGQTALNPASSVASQPLISIDSPRLNDEFLIDQGLPLKDQRIPLRVTVPLDADEVNYFIDGVKVASVEEAPFTYLWLPKLGEHMVRVELLDGNNVLHKSSEVRFLVAGRAR